MPRFGAWTKWSGILATATDRDFERKVLPFLHLYWPTLQQVPAMGSWDAKGIDLLVWADTGPFPCVVQCKGFKVQEIGDRQTSQVKKSIEDFRKSDVVCDTYLVIHNREGKNREFKKTVDALLDQLVLERKAKRAELWDRQTLLDRAFVRLREILDGALREHSQRLLDHFQRLFEFGHHYIRTVPASERRLIFRRGEPCICEDVYPVRSCDVSGLLLSRSRTRWTLLTGRFGSGKTTAILHAATLAGHAIILVPCATLPSSFPLTSTNMLLEETSKSLGVLDEFEGQDREVIYELAGPTLLYLLKQAKSPYVLILDGLDENRAYSNLAGLQSLSNQLADLNCPIILTTRVEHLNAMFGDFSLAFNEFSAKKGPKRNARLLELAQWENNQVVQLVEEIIAESEGLARQRLSDFLNLLHTGEHVYLYADLPFSPLFLQFILEDVAVEGLRSANRSELLYRWVKRKIRRDRAIPVRLVPSDSMDVEDFIDRMLRLMEKLSSLMAQKVGDTYELLESVGSDVVIEEAEKFFKGTSDQVLGILLNSVLLPQAIRQGSILNIAFAFRVFQEFFLASYLARTDSSPLSYSDTVKTFYSEMKSRVSPP